MERRRSEVVDVIWTTWLVGVSFWLLISIVQITINITRLDALEQRVEQLEGE